MNCINLSRLNILIKIRWINIIKIWSAINHQVYNQRFLILLINFKLPSMLFVLLLGGIDIIVQWVRRCTLFLQCVISNFLSFLSLWWCAAAQVKWIEDLLLNLIMILPDTYWYLILFSRMRFEHYKLIIRIIVHFIVSQKHLFRRIMAFDKIIVPSI